MIDNSERVKELRNKYNEFIYEDFEVREDSEKIYLKYKFVIPGLTTFNPEISIAKKKYIKEKNLDNYIVKNLAFHIGLVELISYWKCTFSPNVIIKCGHLNGEQIEWFKKLYYYGLGELMYTNNIRISIDEFMNIETAPNSNENINYDSINDDFLGYIVPIGGGKDSVVTLENLPLDKKTDYCLIVNPKKVTLDCASVAGFENSNIIEIYRKIDANLLELNQQGFINGHTPFSALLSFLTYFVGYLTHKKNITLSNESSANESNVAGEKINHQYSKTYEYENDFYDYSNKYLKVPVRYFSFLRPLNELQIAMLFSRYEKYHKIFKSCNVGSKGQEWIWCGKCPKCLFVYTILSPFLYKEKLINIFGKDLFEDEELLKTFVELCGYGDVKPFECVGTFEEVRFAINRTIENIEKNDEELPYLLKYYKDNYETEEIKEDITKRYNEQHNLPEELNEILRKEIFENGRAY